MNLPPHVSECFQECMRLQPHWHPHEQALTSAPREPGIYALGLPTGIRYDGGVSCIAYIGSAANLWQRLSQHWHRPHNWNVSKLREVYGPLSVAWWQLPHFDKNWRMTVEGEAICRFERQFGSIPICNLAVQHTPHAKLLRDLIGIAECVVAQPISLDDFASLNFRLRPKFRPASSKSSITANQWFYEGVEWPSDAQLAELARTREIEDLSWMNEEAVTAWPIAKMRALLKTVASLKPDNRGSSVIRFQAHRRTIPRPHTWGEVALVQGRISLGTWYPLQRSWVKVLFGHEILGQAILGPKFFRGEDKSDLPQRRKLARRRVPDLAKIEACFQNALLES
jgi:hypothetical protein